MLLLIVGLFTSCQDEPTAQSSETGATEAIVFETDSTEWRVCIFAEHLLYSKAVEVNLPSPWLLPTREDAQILKTCTYPHDERFVTSDGYTFGMPSSSVSKAGQKTQYSVLGLWKRPTTISVQFSRSR
ncbi:MAG: hypothetical protein II588_04495 [Paludibacteraceae bacterium]|nr:hypothetical protein [Paludibacteraceae bacterium]